MKTTILKIVFLSLLFVSCEKINSTAQYSYQSPGDYKDGIEVGTLEEVNMEEEAIEEAVSKTQVYHPILHNDLSVSI